MEKILIDGKQWYRVFTRLSINHAREVTAQEIVTSKNGPAEVAEAGDYVMFTTGVDFQRVVRRFMAERSYSAVPFDRSSGGGIILHADKGNEGWAFEKLAAHLYVTKRTVQAVRSYYINDEFTLEADFVWEDTPPDENSGAV